MGKCVVKDSSGCFNPKEAVKVKDLIAEGEVATNEVIYEITSKDMRILNPEETVKPGGKYGVMPGNSVG